jgi:hypothetical protein
MDTNVVRRGRRRTYIAVKSRRRVGSPASLPDSAASLPEIAWKAIFLNRISLIANANLAYVYVNAHRFDDAIAQRRKTLEIDPVGRRTGDASQRRGYNIRVNSWLNQGLFWRGC